MPMAHLGNCGIRVKRATLRQHEAAHVLQLTPRETRLRLERKCPPLLTPVYVGRRREIDVVELAATSEVRGSPLAATVLAAIADGRLIVRPPMSPSHPPVPLTASVRELATSDRPAI